VYFEGAVLIEDTWNPEFEACRALVTRGITGRLEVWRADKPYPCLIFPDIEEGARWTVEESDTVGPPHRALEAVSRHSPAGCRPRGGVGASEE
jgi:hypothetical protein